MTKPDSNLVATLEEICEALEGGMPQDCSCDGAEGGKGECAPSRALRLAKEAIASVTALEKRVADAGHEIDGIELLGEESFRELVSAKGDRDTFRRALEEIDDICGGPAITRNELAHAIRDLCHSMLGRWACTNCGKIQTHDNRRVMRVHDGGWGASPVCGECADKDAKDV